MGSSIVRIVILASGAAVVQHWSHPGDNVGGYKLRLRHAPRTRPLIAKATNGRPMSMKTSGQGFVSKAEKAEIVEYSTKRNANQQTIAIFKPAPAFVALSRSIIHASA